MCGKPTSSMAAGRQVHGARCKKKGLTIEIPSGDTVTASKQTTKKLPSARSSHLLFPFPHRTYSPLAQHQHSHPHPLPSHIKPPTNPQNPARLLHLDARRARLRKEFPSRRQQNRKLDDRKGLREVHQPAQGRRHPAHQPARRGPHTVPRRPVHGCFPRPARDT